MICCSTKVRASITMVVLNKWRLGKKLGQPIDGLPTKVKNLQILEPDPDCKKTPINLNCILWFELFLYTFLLFMLVAIWSASNECRCFQNRYDERLPVPSVIDELIPPTDLLCLLTQSHSLNIINKNEQCLNISSFLFMVISILQQTTLSKIKHIQY